MPDHPKTVRRRILLFLYQRYQNDPLEMLAPEDFMDDGHIPRRALLSNIYYLHDRGLVELMIGYNPPMFAAARITADGIDLVENTFEFNLWFPEHPSQYEEAKQTVPRLIEQLVQEADFAPLDGERRKCLLRDVQYLRDELARPAERWRTDVIDTVLDWLAAHFDKPEQALPSLATLKNAVHERPRPRSLRKKGQKKQKGNANSG